jgi:quinol monooxygenase YgiN
MFLVAYEFVVKKEKQEEYKKITKEVIKPFWEKKGCSYVVYQSQEDPTKFLKIMKFPEESVLKKSLFEKDEETERIVELFKSFVENLKRSVYQEII